MNVDFRKHRYMLFTLLLLILVNLFAVPRLYTLKGYADMLILCCPGGTLSASVWEQLKNQDANEKTEENELFSQAALWKSLKEITILSEQNGREQKVSCYQIKGQPGAVFGEGLLSGRYFTEKEDNVCLLDRDTARKLFGSEHVLGMEVRINGTCCRIIGILSESRPVCVIPAGVGASSAGGSGAGGGASSAGGTGAEGGAPSAGETGAEGGASSAGGTRVGGGISSAGADGGYDGAAVRKKESGQSSDLTISRMETLFGRAGGQRIDGHLYYMTACLIHFGAFSWIFVLAGIVLGKRTHKKRIAAVCLAAAAGTLWLGIRLAAPGSDYLPSYWSDFDFFSRIFQEKIKQIRELAAYQEFSAWQELFRAWQQVIGADIFGGMVCIISFYYTGYVKK